MGKGIIVLGSSRNNGDTYKLCEYLSNKTAFPILKLKEKNIAEFDYDNNYPKDDQYMHIMRDIANNYDQLILASPVYWYTMSGIMKTFFDRFTDCLRYEKETGRKFRGKSMAVLSCSTPDLIEGFYMPYQESAKYLGMNYLAEVHGYLEDGEINQEVKERLDGFIKEIG